MPTSKPIAVTGSPNTVTELAIDVLEDYINTPLLGALVNLPIKVKTPSGINDVLVIGQVSELKTENRWHEDPSLKNYIKRKGTLPNLTEVGDITNGKLQIIGAYIKDGNSYKKTRMSVPPGSGQPLSIADKNTIVSIMDSEKNHIAYLGKFYGTADVPAPVYVRHFGDFKLGGTGEAYMGGFFGPSGSGKSVVAATMNALWAKNPEMGMLILDPQSEFSSNQFSQGQKFQFDFHKMLQTTTQGKFDPANDLVSVDEIQLDGTTLFTTLLKERNFFKTLGLGASKIPDACEHVEGELDSIISSTKNWSLGMKLDELEQKHPTTYDDLKQAVIQACVLSYATQSRDTKRAEFTASWDNTAHSALVSIWNTVADLFSPVQPSGKNKQDLVTLVSDIMHMGRKVILDLDPSHLNLRDDFKLLIMQFVFKKISAAAHKSYKSSTKANCLIVMDEAGRFIPQTPEDNIKKEMSSYITAKVRELRKFRVGFQFITQNITEIQKDIFRNLHYRVYGVGLAVGADADHIQAREGKEAFAMYNSLPDPRLSGTFSYMVCGAILSLGTTGKPMYIEGYESDAKILAENSFLYSSHTPPKSDQSLGDQPDWGK